MFSSHKTEENQFPQENKEQTKFRGKKLPRYEGVV